jgi:hypothetical protein
LTGETASGDPVAWHNGAVAHTPMSWLLMDDKDLKAQLQAIPSKARTALAAACAERVYKVWEEHWVGDYSAAVKDAVAFGWDYATTASADLPGTAALLADLGPLVEHLNDEGIGILANAATVSLRVIESVIADNAASALALERALGSALFVAKLAGKLSGQGKDKAQQEELDWQDSALKVATSWQGPCDRKMFDGLGSTPPQWWLAYQAGGKYY